MKLRQKLAAALAATMVVTAVPVTTMAASTNRITRTETVKVDEKFSTDLVIEVEDTLTSGSVFFLELTGGELVEGTKTYETKKGTQITVVATEEEATVTANGEIQADDIITIPVNGTAKEDEVVLELLAENSTLTSGKFVVARTTDAKGNVTVGDVENVYTQGKIAEIKIEEAVAKSFEKGDEFTITLTSDEYKFINESQIKAAVGKGFLAAGVKVEAKITDEDEITVKILELDKTTATARGMITISDVTVKSTEKEPETGDLNVTVAGDSIEDATVKVANVAAYGSTLTVKDDEVVEFVAGDTEEVEFTLEENVDDSIASGRLVEFKLDNGYFSTGSTIKLGDTTIATINAETIKAEECTYKVGDKTYTTSLVVEEIDDVDRVVGFEITLDASATAIDEYEFKATVDAGVDFAGDITLTAEGRAIGETLETQIATVKAPFEVKAETATVKVGLKDQKAGKIVIAETEKDMIKKGNIVIELENEKGMEFTEAPKVEVTGDIKVDEAKVETTKDGKVLVTVPVTRTSREASTITISEFGMDVDRTVAEGTFDAKIGGTAIAKNGSTVTVEDFVVVGTPNTEDAVNGMKKGTASFVIGSKTYTVNGTEKEMDAAAYVTASGRTMLPIRYVSEAFGIQGNNIIFTKADGTITILAGNRTLQMKNGSNIAVLNGASIKMDEKVVIKDGRTYVPVGEIGRLLGVSVSFDDATKTATFTNK